MYVCMYVCVSMHVSINLFCNKTYSLYVCVCVCVYQTRHNHYVYMCSINKSILQQQNIFTSNEYVAASRPIHAYFVASRPIHSYCMLHQDPFTPILHQDPFTPMLHQDPFTPMLHQDPCTMYVCMYQQIYVVTKTYALLFCSIKTYSLHTVCCIKTHSLLLYPC